MPDILKYIVAEPATEEDPNGHLLTLEEWTPKIAEQRAREQQLALTPKHWEVIYFLRRHYMQQGPAQHARELVAALDNRFAKEGGRKYLYQLFPGGPVKQASAIAGLPAPADATDRSFGSVQ
jgi:tRNA 2-thiouridine synthesizing protein E